MSKRVMVIATMLTIGLFSSLGLAQDTTQDSSMKKDPMKQDSMKKDSSSTIGSSDKKFIMEAAHGGMMEVELSRMAVDKASNPEVKQFAQRLVDDHSKANDELMQLASQKGISLPSNAGHAMTSSPDSGADQTSGTSQTGSMVQTSSTSRTSQTGGMDKAHQDMMKTSDKLSKLSGADFDREYMEMMVKDHVKDVKKFEDASNKAKDTDVKNWAAKTLPTLREHLQMARDINGKVAMTKSK